MEITINEFENVFARIKYLLEEKVELEKEIPYATARIKTLISQRITELDKEVESIKWVTLKRI